MIKYNEKIKIPYYDTDKNHKLSPVRFLEYLAELSVIHNSNLVDLQKMESLNYGWMLNRWKVKINQYPSGGEVIRVETWISGFEKFYANREFIIYNEEDIEIGKATAVWIFLDMNKKRPIRITNEYYNLNNICNYKIFNEFYRFPLEIEVDTNIKFNIRKSDIDYNKHVNNTKYLEWVIESIPDEIYNKCTLNEFEIQYKKEIKYPNKIISGSKLLKDKLGDKEYIHNIIQEKSKEQNAVILTKWTIK